LVREGECELFEVDENGKFSSFVREVLAEYY